MDIYLPFGRQNVHQHVFYQMIPHWTLCDVAGLSYQTETKCQTVKNDSKKIKIGQKSFFGAIFDFLGKSDTENSKFAKILTFEQCLPEIRALKVVKWPKKWKNGPKVEVWFFCVFVNRPWRTLISTRFWWFYDPLPRYGSQKMQKRPKLTLNGVKI